MMNLNSILENIRPLDQGSMEKTKALWDTRTHPIGSLGALEEMTIRLGGIYEKIPQELERRGIVVMSADNGVYEEDITSSPQSFTYMLTNAMADGQTGISALAQRGNIDVFVVDIGVIPFGEFHSKVLRKNIRPSTGNLRIEPALSKEEVLKAIEVGFQLVGELKEKGYDILGTGELGIANTTTSAAVLAAFTGLPVKDCVGYGAGITENQLKKKIQVVEEALAMHRPDPQDPIDVLSAVGGLDICGLTGIFLGGAYYRIPVVMDGLISGVAALAAVRLNPVVKDFLFSSHLSKERGAAEVFKELGMKAIVDLDMRLGEGSGCPFTISILDHGLYALHHMGTFDSTEIEHHVQVNLRDGAGE